MKLSYNILWSQNQVEGQLSAGRKLVLRFFVIEIEYIPKSCSESHNICYLQYKIEIFEEGMEAN